MAYMPYGASRDGFEQVDWGIKQSKPNPKCLRDNIRLSSKQAKGPDVQYRQLNGCRNISRKELCHPLPRGRKETASQFGGYAALALLAVAIPGLLGGCTNSAPSPVPPQDSPESSMPLRVLVVDDPGLVDAVQREWTARADSEIVLVQMSSEELVDPRRKRLAADVVIYPSGLLGELAERDWIAPISRDVFNGPEFGRRDIFDLIQQREIIWGEQVYAVPLGSPPLTLIYNASLFEQIGAEPPRTWQEYAQLCEQLAIVDNSPAEDSAGDAVTHAVAEPLGPGWAGQVLLARAAGYARNRSYFAALFDLDTMQPLIDSPAFVRALDELAIAAKCGPTDAMEYSPADVRRLLLGGRCAMGLTWPSSAEVDAGEAVQTPTDAASVSLITAELPGARQVYSMADQQWKDRKSSESGRVTLLSVSGRVGSVTKTAPRARAALDMLLRLSSAEWSQAVSPHSPATTLYRTSQIPKATAWVGSDFEADATDAYAEQVKETLQRSLSITSVRLPGRKRYLDALDEAVNTAIGGEQTAEVCLKKAAARWREITEEIGVEQQKAAYWRSLGLEL